MIIAGHRDQRRAQTKTARQVVLAERRQTGDGATYCLNRRQRYGALCRVSIAKPRRRRSVKGKRHHGDIMGTSPAPTSAAQAAVNLRDPFHAGVREVVMTALLPIAAALLQLPATPPEFPVARLEITPSAAAVEVGQLLRLSPPGFDTARPSEPRAQVRKFFRGHRVSLCTTSFSAALI